MITSPQACLYKPDPALHSLATSQAQHSPGSGLHAAAPENKSARRGMRRKAQVQWAACKLLWLLLLLLWSLCEGHVLPGQPLGPCLATCTIGQP